VLSSYTLTSLPTAYKPMPQNLPGLCGKSRRENLSQSKGHTTARVERRTSGFSQQLRSRLQPELAGGRGLSRCEDWITCSCDLEICQVIAAKFNKKQLIIIPAGIGEVILMTRTGC